MKKTILILSVASFFFSCANSKSTAEVVETKNEVSTEVANPEITVSAPQQFIDSSFYVKANPNPVFVDTSAAIIGWPIEYPPYPGEVITPWPPIEIGWWQPFEITYYWFIPDTLDDYKELPIQHVSSNKNCYSFQTNEEGISFTMEVIEPEVVQCALQQVGDCNHHLPLNVSWVNSPLKMKKGNKTIQFNYPKYYELDLIVDFISQYNQQEIFLKT